MTETVSIDAGVFPDSEACPDCEGFIFRPGPRAGLSQNIECVGCGARYSITRWDPRLDGGRRDGPMPIVWAQRIDNDVEWREDLFPRVLE
jgi:hypothetical protein